MNGKLRGLQKTPRIIDHCAMDNRVKPLLMSALQTLASG